jgi:succinate dehydrogenase / fumarate reductase membrane anchor subunit
MISRMTRGTPGFGHWWTQRLTAVALIPLSLWFAASLLAHAGADRAAIKVWLAAPFSAVLMLLTLGATLLHGVLGVEEVIVDYVHHTGARLVCLIVVRLGGALLAAASLYAVLRLAFGA